MYELARMREALTQRTIGIGGPRELFPRCALLVCGHKDRRNAVIVEGRKERRVQTRKRLVMNVRLYDQRLENERQQGKSKERGLLQRRRAERLRASAL